jgi:hypothetical protein
MSHICGGSDHAACVMCVLVLGDRAPSEPGLDVYVPVAVAERYDGHKSRGGVLLRSLRLLSVSTSVSMANRWGAR